MDTRDKNQAFSMTNAYDHLFDYTKSLVTALSSINHEQITKAADALFLARQLNRRIFSAGNGGSAAIASHLNCDFQKGCHHGNTLNTHCLTDNVPLVTAIANDLAYELVFSKQLEYANPNPGEVLILISSSGNSPNIIAAAKFAIEREMTIIGLTGFDGGRLKQMATISLHVPVHNYGVAEDAHMALVHSLAQFHYRSVKLDQPEVGKPS